MPLSRSRIYDLTATAIFIAFVGYQILGPHPIGVADNGDFPKVLGPSRIWVAPEFESQRYQYFVTDYRIDHNRIYDPEIPTFESVFVEVAKQVGIWLLPPDRFDMRVLGAVHAVVATLAFSLALNALHSLAWTFRVLITVMLLLIFSDAALVAFFNTAFMDAGSIVCLMLTFAIGLNIVLDRSKANWKWALTFGVSAACFLATKLQHQPCVLLLAACSIVIAMRAQSLPSRITWIAIPVALAAVSFFMLHTTPPDYRVESAFSTVFKKMLPLSQDKLATLRELDLPASYIRFDNMHAFQQGVPIDDQQFRRDFLRNVSSARFLTFYAHHQDIAARILWSDYLLFVPVWPFGDNGALRKIDNPQPYQNPQGFYAWIWFRNITMLLWPPSIFIPFALAFLVAIAASLSPRLASRFPGWPLCFTLAGMGILCYAVGSLGDATNTSRHLVLFRELTDLLLVSLVICIPGPKQCL